MLYRLVPNSDGSMLMLCSHFRLKGFTATPEAQREMFLSHSGAKQIASKVITDYAKHLKEEQQRTMPHMAAVNEYMALPDTAEDLLYY